MDEEELLRLLTGERHDPIFVCKIADRVAAAIQSHTRVVWLSQQTVFKQEVKRRPAEHSLYLRAPVIIERGEVRIEPPYHAIFVYDENGDKLRTFKAVVKATRDRRELFLVSIHRLDKFSRRALDRRTMTLDEVEKGRREVGPPKNPT